MTERLTYGVTGQVLRHVPGTRQVTAEWALEDLRYSYSTTARTLDSGTALVDAATEPLLTDAGPGQADPTLLEVASTTGFALRFDQYGEPKATYEIVTPDGRREYFTLAGITTDASLHTLEPLQRPYPAGCTIRGVELVTAPILAAVLTDEQRALSDWPMRVVWRYPDGFRAQEQVRIVRDDAIDLSVDDVTDDVLGLFPELATRLEYQGRPTLPAFIRTAIRQVRADALSRGIELERFLSGEQGHWAVVYRTLHHLAQMGHAPGNAEDTETLRGWREYTKASYDARWLGLTVGEPGSEVVETEPTSGTAPSSGSTVYREIITGL
jgi:hypothetical protein